MRAHSFQPIVITEDWRASDYNSKFAERAGIMVNLHNPASPGEPLKELLGNLCNSAYRPHWRAKHSDFRMLHGRNSVKMEEPSGLERRFRFRGDDQGALREFFRALGNPGLPGFVHARLGMPAGLLDSQISWKPGSRFAASSSKVRVAEHPLHAPRKPIKASSNVPIPFRRETRARYTSCSF